MMEIKEVEADENGFAKVIVTIPAADMPKMIEDAFGVLVTSGRVPVVEGQSNREAVEKVIGADKAAIMLPHVIMDRATSMALGQKGVLPVTRPQGKTESEAKPDEDFTFEATYVANPGVELSSYEPVTVKVPVATISDQEIDRQIEYIAQSAAKPDKDGHPVIPAITDTWVKTNIRGCETVPEFRERLRKDMLAEKSRRIEQAKGGNCVAQLATRVHEKLPKGADAVSADEARESLEADIRQHGMTHEQFCKQQGLDEATFSMMLNMQASMELRQGLALDALARHLGYIAEEADLKRVFDYIAEQEHLESAAVRKDFEDCNRMLQASQLALRMKASDWLRETATYVTEGDKPEAAPESATAAESAAAAPEAAESEKPAASTGAEAPAAE